MPAITISRQLGSLGYQIALSVVDTLGYKLVWRELINKAARRTGTPEVALAAIDELGILWRINSPIIPPYAFWYWLFSRRLSRFSERPVNY